jgi:proteic killer suppression protein
MSNLKLDYLIYPQSFQKVGEIVFVRKICECGFLLLFLCQINITMEITFDQKYLSELYFDGSTKDKKHRFQPHIVRKYVQVIDTLMAAKAVEDLYRFHSLNYKVLSGDKSGIESVRVNDQYRIEFKTNTSGTEPIITICNILELSNHYK